MRRAIVGSFAAAMGLVASGALAGPRVVIVTGPGGAASADADLETIRLRRELAALGFEVSTVEATDDALSSMDALARSQGAAAAIRLVKEGARVEVWLRDRVTGKTIVRDVEVENADEDAERAAAVLAVRAVELLRASLLETHETHPSRGEVEPDRVVRAMAGPPAPPLVTPGARSADARPSRREAPRPARWGVDAGPGVAWSAGGAPAALVLAVGARWMPSPWAGVTIRADLPTWAPSLEEPEGSAALRVGRVLAGARFEPAAGTKLLLSPFVEGGIGLSWVAVTGIVARSGYVTRQDETFAATPFLRAGALLPIAAPLSLRADVGAAFALPPATVTFAGREAIDLGTPWITGGGAADLSF